MFVAYANSRLIKKGRITQKRLKTLRFTTEKSKKDSNRQVVKSKLTSAGYLLMLVDIGRYWWNGPVHINEKSEK